MSGKVKWLNTWGPTFLIDIRAIIQMNLRCRSKCQNTEFTTLLIGTLEIFKDMMDGKSASIILRKLPPLNA